MAETELGDISEKWNTRIDEWWGLTAEMKVPVSELRTLCAAASRAAEAEAVSARTMDDVGALRAELAEAKAELEKLEGILSDTMEARDHAEDAADELAGTIGSIEEIGEHSNLNNPWANAVDLAESKFAEIDALRTQLAAQASELEQAKRDLAYANEAVQHASAGRPLGPLVGAQTILEQAHALKAQAETIAKLRAALEMLSVVDDTSECFQQPTLRGIARVAKDALAAGAKGK